MQIRDLDVFDRKIDNALIARKRLLVKKLELYEKYASGSDEEKKQALDDLLPLVKREEEFNHLLEKGVRKAIPILRKTDTSDFSVDVKNLNRTMIYFFKDALKRLKSYRKRAYLERRAIDHRFSLIALSSIEEVWADVTKEISEDLHFVNEYRQKLHLVQGGLLDEKHHQLSIRLNVRTLMGVMSASGSAYSVFAYLQKATGSEELALRLTGFLSLFILANHIIQSSIPESSTKRLAEQISSEVLKSVDLKRGRRVRNS